MKRIEANKILKTFNWIWHADKEYKTVLEPILNEDNIYEFEIHLPLINKTVIGLGDDKMESIDNATQQASNLIDEYVEKHPEAPAINGFGDWRYVLEEDDGGHLRLYISQNKVS